tara:strand:+ start:47056 stop:47235 length:180 start_codon:yes stop_codon:yes gene_type:complete
MHFIEKATFYYRKEPIPTLWTKPELLTYCSRTVICVFLDIKSPDEGYTKNGFRYKALMQ